MSKILLVDDDEDMMRICANWLKKAGYETVTANSGSAALEALRRERADLILLDYAMPGMDGPSTLAAIRQDASLKDIPVLFRTGMEDRDAADTMQRLHADGVVPKSEGKAMLMEAVRDLLS